MLVSLPRFLTWVPLWSLALGWGGIALQARCDTARPNIVVLMADNWAWPHAGSFGAPVVKTPTIDHLASQGVVFHHAFCLAPSCAPARAAFLTGQTIHRLGEAANLWGIFPTGHEVFTQRLAEAGYQVGFSGKGWAPGKWQEAGWAMNPAGEKFKTAASFLEQTSADQPFFFWFSSRYPHIPWEDGEERKAHMDASAVEVPDYLPDHPLVRDNILDYFAEVELFDQECQEILQLLNDRGLSDNTIVILCGDNGWQMPHGLAHIYDAGTRVPLVFSALGHSSWASRECGELVNFDDLGPTILELAGAEPLSHATGVSLMALLEGREWIDREAVFLSRERHANVRSGNGSYPVRAVRSHDFLYVRNFMPERWPAGDPELWYAVGPFGDVDYTYTKEFLLEHREESDYQRFFAMNFGKRPSEELYDLKQDPDQTRNVAQFAVYGQTKARLSQMLARWMQTTQDPRANEPRTKFWDEAEYFGKRATPTTQRPKRDLPLKK